MTTMTDSVEEWIKADGPAAETIRRSLVAWLNHISATTDPALYPAVIKSMIHMARDTALSYPSERNIWSAELYRAADKVATNDS